MLRPCGPRRDCVSTQASASDHTRRLVPLRYAASASDATEAIVRVLESMPRAKVLERDHRSVHAVLVSRIMRVASDIDVRIDDAQGLLHLRVSAPKVPLRRSSSRDHALLLLAAIEREIRRMT